MTENPHQINNWNIKKLLWLVSIIQLAMLGLVGLAALGFDIPVLRQAVGFVYLAFVPGLLILRIFRLHKLGITETLLYSVGFSIVLVMFLGFLMNTLYPLLGISKPISILPLITTLTAAVAILCVVAYIRESRATMTHSGHQSMPWSEIFSPPTLFLLLLPLVSVLGAYYLANFYQNNILLLILIGLIALVAALVAFDKFIPPRLYSLAVVMIAISLLWHWSLISQYLTGWDIQIEYYSQNLVLNNSLWDPTIPSNVNSMLSIAILAPIYSLILNMDSVWVFKIIYPLFFSLVPLALFQIFRKQTNDQIAFFAVFFFMSMFTFFTTMLGLARQQIAELFLALSILLFVSKEMATIKRTTLLIIFGFSIVASHYGLSYIYVLYLLMAMPWLLLRRGDAVKGMWRSAITRFSKLRHRLSTTHQSSKLTSEPRPRSTLSVMYAVLFIFFLLAWYMNVGSGVPLDTAIRVVNWVYSGVMPLPAEEVVGPLPAIFDLEARDPTVSLALGLAPPAADSAQRETFRILQWLTQFFIVVGILGLIASWRKTRFHPEYAVMSLASMVIIAMCIILPYLTFFLSMTRIYHITLFFLAPFCILGGITVFKWLFRLVPTGLFRASSNPIYLNLVVVLVLIPYLLFNTGFIFEVSGDTPTSISLNAEKDYPRFNEREVSGKEWLSLNKEEATKVFADQFGWLLLREYIPRQQLGTFWGETLKTPDNTYIYLRSWNVKQGEVALSWEDHLKYIDLRRSPFGEEVLAHRNKIYDNGGAQVYR